MAGQPARKGIATKRATAALPARKVATRPAPKAAAKTAARPKPQRTPARQAAGHRPLGAGAVAAGSNRLSAALQGVSLRNASAVNAVMRDVPYHAVDLAPAFREQFVTE